MAAIAYLECTRCGEHFDADRPQTVCPKDGGVLYVRYDLAALRKTFPAASVAGRTPNMWRYAEVLPEAEPVSLGEGFTPLLPSREFPSIYIKDEGLNPTGSFKARGMSAAVTMAKAYGLKKLAAPSAGNAASALAAYSAAAGIEAHIFMPKDVPLANQVSSADSSKDGQFFNTAAWGGVSSPTYGTLTYGRQNSLTLDGVIAYDPLAGSGAFSAIGFQGTTAGMGDTENARLDNSIKYLVNIGPFRAATAV